MKNHVCMPLSYTMGLYTMIFYTSFVQISASVNRPHVPQNLVPYPKERGSGGDAAGAGAKEKVKDPGPRDTLSLRGTAAA